MFSRCRLFAGEFLVVFVFETILPGIPGWPWNCDRSVSASWVWLQAYTLTFVYFQGLKGGLISSCEIAGLALTYRLCILQLFSGLLVNLTTIASWLSWLQYFSIPRYGYTVSCPCLSWWPESRSPKLGMVGRSLTLSYPQPQVGPCPLQVSSQKQWLIIFY